MPTPSNDEGALVANNERRAASDDRFAPAHQHDDHDSWGPDLTDADTDPNGLDLGRLRKSRGKSVAGAPAAAETDEADDAADREAEETLLEQLGGISGLIYSTLPVVVFVPANALWGLGAAIWTALGVAAAILVWRLARRNPIQPAISGFLGVGVCAFIAYRMGAAKGFFLFGIWASLLYAGVFLASLVVRWPLAGVIWGVLNGHGTQWRSDRRVVRLYDLATLVWVLVFGARYLVQSHFYATNSTGLLAVTRIAMGWPLTAVALLVTVWAVRRAGHAPAAAD
ncbi:phage shock protein PspC (stress-responsive transcriptional regulator) [Nocardia sp. GAS34]